MLDSSSPSRSSACFDINDRSWLLIVGGANLAVIEAEPVVQLYHRGTFSRDSLKASRRWKQNAQQLSALQERWLAHKATW